MKFATKPFEWYWQVMRWPLIILVAWGLAGLIMSFISFETYIDVFTNTLVSYSIPAVMFIIAGYLATADQQATPKQAAWSGALTGIIAGALGIIFTIIMIKATPLIEWTVEQAIASMAASGQPVVNHDQLRGIIMVTTTIGMVVSPIISGLFGALFGWVGNLIAHEIEK